MPPHIDILIRNETAADVRAISELTAIAFATLEVSDHTEQFIIDALRAAKALTLSLVAEIDGRVVGHIAFSPVTIADAEDRKKIAADSANWYGLGPVSVQPAYQRKGIGAALIREGLSRLQKMNARGCCLVGHPGYYRKFGFENTPRLVYEGVPPEFFFALAFGNPEPPESYPQGKVIFHDAFNAKGP